jgi:hypothetical protein
VWLFVVAAVAARRRIRSASVRKEPHKGRL